MTEEELRNDKDEVEGRLRVILSLLYSNICLFSLIVLKKHFDMKPAKFHIDVYNKLLAPSKKKCIVAPRRHSKSTVVSLCYVLWCALFQQKQYIVIISDTYTQSAMFLNAIKDEIETNEIIKALWGNLKGSIWREDVIVFTSGVMIACKGADQPMRGLKYKNQRPDLIIGDDLENDEMIESMERRDSLYRWIYKTVIPALAKGGTFVIIGTILHYDSVLLRIYKDSSFDSLFFSAIENGKPLWEDMFSMEDLMNIKKEYAEAGMLDVFYSEYLNEPISSENAPFKKDWLKFYDEPPSLHSLNRFIGVDLAISKKASADWSVITVVGIDALNRVYVLESRREKADPFDLAVELLRLCKKYKPYCVGLETTAYQKAFQYIFEKLMKDEQDWYMIEEIKPDTDKERRIKGVLQHRFKNGDVFLNKNQESLLEELLGFPKTRYDDTLDSLAHAVMVSSPPANSSPFTIKNNSGRGRQFVSSSATSLSKYI